MKTILLTKIQFPELELKARDAHKLRGYFGNLFKNNSELLHNHYDTGELRYKYPLVQYKILDKIPTLVAIEEGAELLTKLFLKIRQIDIDGKVYEINSKQIENKKIKSGYTEDLMEYQFQTLWMGLNQNNYKKYLETENTDKQKFLSKILIGNILSFYKNIDLRLEASEKLLANTKLTEKQTKFKDNKMIAFEGSFITNALLPDHIGLGKAVSRGFGSISKIN